HAYAGELGLAQHGARESDGGPVATDDNDEVELAALKETTDELAAREARLEEVAVGEGAANVGGVRALRGIAARGAERTVREHARPGHDCGHIETEERHGRMSLALERPALPAGAGDRLVRARGRARLGTKGHGWSLVAY